MLSDGKPHSNIDLDQSSNESNESERALAELGGTFSFTSTGHRHPQRRIVNPRRSMRERTILSRWSLHPIFFSVLNYALSQSFML